MKDFHNSHRQLLARSHFEKPEKKGLTRPIYENVSVRLWNRFGIGKPVTYRQNIKLKNACFCDIHDISPSLYRTEIISSKLNFYPW